MKLRIFVTGGTFDKEYDEIQGRLFFKDTHLPEMLKLGRCGIEVEVRTLMMIDSLEMTEADRALIIDQVLKSAEDRIVITHGTDTMEITAQALCQARSSSPEKWGQKTVILTGAMIPYPFGSSDGLFNLGSALAFAQALPPGVYVAMNGRVFPGDQVTKDRSTGRFRNK
jgi:L-asparaginase